MLYQQYCIMSSYPLVFSFNTICDIRVAGWSENADNTVIILYLLDSSIDNEELARLFFSPSGYAGTLSGREDAMNGSGTEMGVLGGHIDLLANTILNANATLDTIQSVIMSFVALVQATLSNFSHPHLSQHGPALTSGLSSLLSILPSGGTAQSGPQQIAPSVLSPPPIISSSSSSSSSSTSNLSTHHSTALVSPCPFPSSASSLVVADIGGTGGAIHMPPVTSMLLSTMYPTSKNIEVSLAQYGVGYDMV